MTFNPAAVGMIQAAGLQASAASLESTAIAGQSQALAAESISSTTYSSSNDRSGLQRVVLGLGVSASLLTFGCSEPRPAALPNEAQIPPNQQQCAPGSRSPYCQAQQSSLQQMERYREEGHHTDQALFAILGAVTLLSFVGNAFQFIRGRKIRRRLAALEKNQSQAPTPPPTQPTTSEVSPKAGVK